MSSAWQTRERGSGPPVVLLHAFPFDGRMWDVQLDALAASHRVIVPEMPGFGGAPAWAVEPTVDAWAASLLGHLGTMGLTEAVVAGCSMGGYLAFAIHRANPNFIRGLALVDSRAVPDSPERLDARLRDAERVIRQGRAFFIDAALEALTRELEAYPDALARARAMLADATGAGISGALLAIGRRPDARSQLAGIRVPTAVLRGGLDPIVGPKEARDLAAAIGDATYSEIDGAGHIPTFQRPDAVTAALFELLARC